MCTPQECTTVIVHTDIQLVTNILYHHKYLHGRISYYPNSSASFHTELLKCGDVNPNPGPEVDAQVHIYSCPNCMTYGYKANALSYPPPHGPQYRTCRFYHYITGAREVANVNCAPLHVQTNVTLSVTRPYWEPIKH